MPSAIEPIAPKDGPAPGGPYSPGIRANGLIFVSGQIPVDPKTGAMAGESFEVQTRQVIENMRSVLAGAGAPLEHVVKVTIYVADLGKFDELNAVYSEYFGNIRPARTTVQAGALPKGAQVEMDAIAVDPSS